MVSFGRRTPTVDATVAAVDEALRRRGHDVVAVDIADFVRGPCQLDVATGAGRFGSVVLPPFDDVDVIYLGPLPGPSARLVSLDEDLSGAEVDRRQKAQGSRHALAWSYVLAAELRGIEVLSSPSLARPFDHKPFQLMALQHAGLAIPPTTVTDDVTDIGADTIEKPLLGGAVERARGEGRRGHPRLWQTMVHGPEVRAVVVGGHLVASGWMPARDLGDPVDIRQRQGWQDGALRYRNLRTMVGADVFAVVEDVCVRAAKVCHFDVCAIDVIVTEAGPVILDVNRTPQVLDLQVDLDVDIVGAIVLLVETRGETSGTAARF